MAISHPVFARFYQRFADVMERRGGDAHRQRLLEDLRGAVIEVGAGHGINFPYYPPTVTRLVAIEPEPRLRAAARDAADGAPTTVELRDGVAEHLPFDDDTFDAAVVSLVLCSVPDQAVALTEIARVLRPGGELRFYEHVRSRQPGLARFQRTTDVVWPHLAAGCHTARDTLGRIERAGFVVEDLERFRFPEARVPLPTAPHVLGRARLRPPQA